MDDAMIRSGFWRLVVPMAAGVWLALWLLGGDRVPDARLVECPGYVLAIGELEAAEHEQQEGFFNVGKFSISVPREGIPALQLRLLRGKQVEIVIREVKPRTAERLDR